jgi:thiol-disulfide isomerase/thioredoxin
LNTLNRITMNSLRGRVVLVDIWEYSCINCLRTLPYLREWHARYAGQGLTIIGVHVPEFAFGREKQQVEAAVRELQIEYPVLLDNAAETWDAFAARAWPSKYLIDHRGYIRYMSQGEGGYGEFERAIQAALLERDPDVVLPPVMLPLREEDKPGAVCYRPTPELHAGLYDGALGNPQGYGGRVPVFYKMPEQRSLNSFYVEGAWQAGDEYLSYQGQTEGLIQLPYEAVEVNAVFTPHVETVERMLHPQTVSVEIWQDDLPLPDEVRGFDVQEEGRIFVDRPRMYNLVRNADFGKHELTLRVRSRGFALYSFTFTSCVKGNDNL